MKIVWKLDSLEKTILSSAVDIVVCSGIAELLKQPLFFVIGVFLTILNLMVFLKYNDEKQRVGSEKQ